MGTFKNQGGENRGSKWSGRTSREMQPSDGAEPAPTLQSDVNELRRVEEEKKSQSVT